MVRWRERPLPDPSDVGSARLEQAAAPRQDPGKRRCSPRRHESREAFSSLRKIMDGFVCAGSEEQL